ncbi:MAG: hypothetical protein ACLVKK_04700 [Ruthenibacterium sp.]
MKKSEHYAYACGVIDAFCETVAAGVKQLALSHPCTSRAQRDALLPFCEEMCAKRGLLFFAEDSLLITDLFPKSANAGRYVVMFFASPAVYEAYMALKARKAALLAQGAYTGEARRGVAEAFGLLLSYSPEAIARLIAQNTERE